ncbi:MAG: copper homeostasis membrane protein CopD, partial [Sphingomonadaceae bacterium]
GHWLTVSAAGTALATLAWNGHAAASEGVAAPLHLASDIVHLLAAGAWIGALASLVILLFPIGSAMSATRLDVARRALSDFSTTGSIIVGLIVITGVANIGFILGRDTLAVLFTNLYGQLLIAKIALFFAMLGLAAANRFRLTPRLASAMALNDSARAVYMLRFSLITEALAAMLILALVAWLGTLAPMGDAN